MTDYLMMHRDVIQKESFMEGDFVVPATVSEVEAYLPGHKQYDDIDSLLIDIGKTHDRSLIHSFVSKLFKVPLRVLLQAEEARQTMIPRSVLDAVQFNQLQAKDAALAAASAQVEANEDVETETCWV